METGRGSVREFSFKTARLRGLMTVKIDRLGVSIEHEGRKERAEFASITEIYVFVPPGVRRGDATKSVEIVSRNGKKMRFFMTAVFADQNELLDFYRAAAAFLRGYAAAKPGAVARVGHSRGRNVLMASLAGVALVIAWLVQALWDGKIDTTDWLVLPVAFALFAWTFLRRFSVLSEPPAVPASDLAAALAQAADPLVS